MKPGLACVLGPVERVVTGASGHLVEETDWPGLCWVPGSVLGWPKAQLPRRGACELGLGCAVFREVNWGFLNVCCAS